MYFYIAVSECYDFLIECISTETGNSLYHNEMVWRTLPARKSKFNCELFNESISNIGRLSWDEVALFMCFEVHILVLYHCHENHTKFITKY